MLDWQAQQQHLPPDTQFETVFIGGGTPSLFDPEYIQQVLAAMVLSPAAEITMEANPGTTEYTNFSDVCAAGVNRLSIGAQSFDDQTLVRLGRIHHAQETIAAYSNARNAGLSNINLDIMWGLPEQTLQQALTDLDVAIDLAPEHISWYQLTIEAKTEFAVRSPLLPVDDTLARIETEGLKKLTQAGYERYEVSAFAKPGYRCRHNLNYWSFGDYLGLGAGAHGKISTVSQEGYKICRSAKTSQPRRYLSDPELTTYAAIAQDQLPVEFMLNALRLTEGVDFTAFTQATGLSWQAVAPTWAKLVTRGLVRGDRCATTAQGMRYLDSVVAEFLP